MGRKPHDRPERVRTRDDRSPSPHGSVRHTSFGAADSSVQAGSARGVEAQYPSSRDRVGGVSIRRPVLSMGGDPTPGDTLTPAKAPALHQQLASISLETQRTTDVEEAFWIAAM